MQTLTVEAMVSAAIIAGQAAFQKVSGEPPECTWLAELGEPAGNAVHLAQIIVLGGEMTVEDLYLQAMSDLSLDGVRPPRFDRISRRLVAALGAFMAVIRALEPLRCHWLVSDQVIAASGPSKVIALRRGARH